MTDIIDILLRNDKSKKEKRRLISKKVARGDDLDVFFPYTQLSARSSGTGVSVIDYLLKHITIQGFGLQKLIELGAINPNQKNEHNISIVNYCIEKNRVDFFTILIKSGAKITKKSSSLAVKNSEIHKMLGYQPGPDQETLATVCSQKNIDLKAVHNLILDYYDTTDGSDSEPEPLAAPKLKLHKGDRVAFRGIHFAPIYYSHAAREKAKADSKQDIKKTSYSQSALLDAGYKADDDIDEDDKKLKKVVKKHRKFFDTLKETSDQKEQYLNGCNVPITRNRVIFKSHFYRFIQAYINAYSRLFNHSSIQHDFGFFSSNNPLVSLSWSCAKGSMYGLGNRFDQSCRDIYRNPHYRRSTKKPKHPNAGYVDVFLFTQNYIESSTVDRKDLFDRGLIYLSAFYQHEEEVIAFSMVPKEYHRKRCVLSLPNLDTNFASNKDYYAAYGINSAKTLSNIRTLIFNQHTDSESFRAQYHKGLKKLTEHAAIGQSETITKKIR